jgi:hypothetical protein
MAFIMESLGSGCEWTRSASCPFTGFDTRAGQYPYTMHNPTHAGSSLADVSTLKMEAIRSSETSVHTRSTLRHIPEHGILHSLRRENHKSYNLLVYLRFTHDVRSIRFILAFAWRTTRSLRYHSWTPDRDLNRGHRRAKQEWCSLRVALLSLKFLSQGTGWTAAIRNVGPTPSLVPQVGLELRVPATVEFADNWGQFVCARRVVEKPGSFIRIN